MQTLAFLLLASFAQGPRDQALLDSLRLSLDSGQLEGFQRLFVRSSDADQVAEMTERQGLRGLKVKVIPAPPGWGTSGDSWVVFHKPQSIESYHDMVFRVASTPERLLVGSEVPESDTGGWTVGEGKFDVSLFASEGRASVSADLSLVQNSPGRAPVFRLGDPYAVEKAQVDGREANVVTADSMKVPTPSQGDVLRAGGLVIVWDAGKSDRLSLEYGGKPTDSGGDRITEKLCYMTAWWAPTISRKPYGTSTRIEGPADWVLMSEGVETSPQSAGFAPKQPRTGSQIKTFRCEVKLTYPKVVAGRYRLAAEAKDAKGRTFRSFQFDPVQEDRAKKDVELMNRAVAFYEDTLGPWPFPGYACFDGDGYYGIESYSYTLLLRSNTTRFVTHEMGHTYFGGVVPNSYTKDGWNESLTQYVDSVLFSKNADQTLEAGYKTLNVGVPLTEMDRPWMHGSATYFRGAYVMAMLQREIGLESVIEGMKAIVKERKGLDTTWPDLRPYFERVSHVALGWFWDQWVSGATFPTIRATEAQLVRNGNAWTTWVTVRQTGTEKPFRLRFNLVASALDKAKTLEVVLAEGSGTVRVDTDFEPKSIAVDAFGLALATACPPIAPRP